MCMQEMDYKLSVTVYSLVWYLLTHSYDNLCKYSTCTCIVNLRGKWWVLAAFKDLSTMVKLLKSKISRSGDLQLVHVQYITHT